MISREKLLKIRAIIQGFGEQLSELVRPDYVDRATLRICEILDPEVHEPAAEATRPVEVTQNEFETVMRYVTRTDGCKEYVPSVRCRWTHELLSDLGLHLQGADE